MNFPGLLKKGVSHESIKLVKQRLNGLLGSTLDVNNSSFGDSTEAVVKQFQVSRKLEADGVIGKLTWERLFEVAKAPLPVTANKLSQRALQIAETQLGIREATGKNDGAAVESYLKSVGLGKGYAWCAAFVYWCYSQAAKDLNVANPLAKTAGVMNHWNITKGQRVKKPQVGDIFIMSYGKGLGHTGLVKEVKGDRVFTIEGNTNGEGSREGDGVYERNRPMSSIIGYIRY